MMKKIFTIVVALLLVVTMAACSKGFTEVSNDELTTMLESPKDYQFIDVRTSAEFYELKIPGFNNNIDYYILENDYSLLDGLDKSIPVVIMCNSGNRSVDASNIFVDEGFIVYNLTFGIEGWNGSTE
jgi:rhodanese-related sulfurtransferase